MHGRRSRPFVFFSLQSVSSTSVLCVRVVFLNKRKRFITAQVGMLLRVIFMRTSDNSNKIFESLNLNYCESTVVPCSEIFLTPTIQRYSLSLNSERMLFHIG